MGSRLHQALKTLGTLKILCKNLSFSKSFKWHLWNYEDYLWSKFQLKLKLFTGVKGALSGLREFLLTENPLKRMKNAFYFISKALFFLKIFKLFS